MKKYYFVGDAHLGSLLFKDKEEHDNRFISWLDMACADSDEVFLMGDIFDFWFEFAHSIPPGYDKILAALKEKCSTGKKIHFVCGNHDQWTYGYLSNLGLIIHRKPEVITLNGKKILIAHGHGLGEKRKATLIINKIFENSVCQWLFRHLIPPKIGIAFGIKWSADNRKKHDKKAKNNEGENTFIDYYSNNTEESFQMTWAMDYARQHPDTDYIIMAHLHREENRLTGNGTQIVILDEFYNRYGYGVLDETGMSLYNFE